MMFPNVKWVLVLMCFSISQITAPEAGYIISAPLDETIYQQNSNILIDCHPDAHPNENTCIQRGCTWVQSLRNELEPACIFPDGYGYRHTLISKTLNGYHIDLIRNPNTTIFGNEVASLNLAIYEETTKRLRLKFEDKTMKRYEVPLDVPVPPVLSPGNLEYNVSFSNEPQFGLEVKRLSSGNKIFDTNLPGMVFSDQFLQITTKLPSSNIYGLGEHYHEEYKHSTNWNSMTFFARDQSPIDSSWNIYGVHPFYMVIEEDGSAHGVFLLNSNAMQVVIQPYPAITFRAIGGILDFYIFLGPTPEDVVQQYLEVIGLPMMPPYWSLGFQLSRYGYQSTEEVAETSYRMMENKIPYDVQYFDIDYMDSHKDFTVDEVHFHGLGQFVNDLHSQHDIKVIIIVDPAIASDEELKDHYKPLSLGLALDVFIKVNGTILEGNCWPGNVYYPDFSHPQALVYWSQLCSDFREQVAFDGLWIDMNEPSSFVAGSVPGCSSSSLNYPPFLAGVYESELENSIFQKTICMDADQHAGKHYDVHSLYGFFEANITFRALHDIVPGNLRPMIVSRSTYPGAGKHTTHWLGDNFSTWANLRASIIGILEFNLFGFPFVGADICGFNGNTTEELCYRWMQLGAFYPFSRNHNGLGSIPQDPPSFGERVINASRDALTTRYQLLPYLYTLLHLAHTNGSTVARPLLHEFPTDKNTWNIKDQFLWGSALLISPILYENATSVDAFFPEGIWYDFYSGRITKQGNIGTTVNLKDEGHVNLHVRGGHILPLQQPDVTTTKSRENPLGLFVAPAITGPANGLLFLDDGISYETQKNNKYTLINFQYNQEETQAELMSNIQIDGYLDANKLNLSYITICKQSPPRSVVLNGQTLLTDKWEYSEETQVLHFKQLAVAITQNFHLIIHYNP